MDNKFEPNPNKDKEDPFMEELIKQLPKNLDNEGVGYEIDTFAGYCRFNLLETADAVISDEAPAETSAEERHKIKIGMLIEDLNDHFLVIKRKLDVYSGHTQRDKERRKVVFSPEITGQAMPVMKLYFIGS